MFGSVSSAPKEVTLYTSLPPVNARSAAGRDLGTAYQRECIASWHSRGFNIVSINPRAEIETLLPMNYNVTFKEVDCKRPRICDFIDIIKQERAKVAGIINSDCIMIANEPAISLFLQSAKQGLVLVERINFAAEDVKPTGLSCSGFDMFLFATKTLENFEFDSEITIGTPWWDYWFPISYHLAGGQLFIAPVPMLMHLDHPQTWSWDSWVKHGRKMHDALAANCKTKATLPFVKYHQEGGISQSELDDLAANTFRWLTSTASQPIKIEDPSAWLWCSVLAGINSMPKVAREAERGFEETKRNFEDAERRLKESLSWKVTKPLRFIERRFRRKA